MNYKKLMPLIVFLFLYCSKNKDIKNEISIELNQSINDEIAFSEFYDIIPFSTLKKIYPEYYSNQLRAYGLSENDSIIIATLNTDYRRFKFELFQAGYVNKAAYDDLRIDSLLEREKPNQKQLVAGISFKNGKQIVSIDANNNNDFSDDEAIVLDEEFRFHASDTNTINKLPIINFNFWSKTKNITYFNRKIIVYPHATYPRFGYSDEESELKSRLLAKFKDYWSGTFTHNEIEYEVAVQGFNNAYATVLIKPKNLKFSNENDGFNYNFTYQIKDTVQVENTLFVLNSLSDTMSELILKRIELKPDNFFSDKIGYKLFDYQLLGINNQNAKLSEITTKNKQYTLLDFWGTWCKPCIELTPKLKQLNKDYFNDIQIISIALDSDIETVASYVQEHSLDWYQGFVSRQNRQGSIISELSIKDYPTFILLDENRNIVYRGVGVAAFNKVENIFKAQFSK